MLGFISKLSPRSAKFTPVRAVPFLPMREAGQGRADREAVRLLRTASCGQGYMARGGQIIDASIVPVPTQRNSRGVDADCRLGSHERRGSRSPPKCGRRTAMRAGPRNGRSPSATRSCERGRQAQADPALCGAEAAVHDSQELDGLLDTGNTAMMCSPKRLSFDQDRGATSSQRL